MSADRRTIIIAALVMVALIGVGAGSAAVFARSACGAIGPDGVPDRAAGTDVQQLVATVFPDLDDRSGGVRAGIDRLADELGPFSGIAEVTGADRIASTMLGVAAVGSTTTSLDASGAEVRATAAFGDAAVIVGDGGLFSLALANPLTGQVDAVSGLDDDLEPGRCVDTATVGTPLAFALDTSRGELLLFRVDEDGSDPEVERRGSTGVRIWTADLDAGLAPPGTLGERLTGALGAELAVVGRRSAATDDPELPVLTAFDRRTGTPRWTLGRELIPVHLQEQNAVWVEVLAVGRDASVLAMSPDEDGARGTTSLVAVAHADPVGAVTPLEVPPGDIVRAEVVGDDEVVVLVRERAGWSLYRTGGPQMPAERIAAGDGDAGGIAVLDDGRIVVAAGAVTIVGPGSVDTYGLDLDAEDVVTHRGGVTLLLRAPEAVAEGEPAVTVTFGR